MQAGSMRYRITVLRRPVVAGGDARGDFAVAFVTRAAFKQMNGFKRAEAGLLENQSGAVLRFYSTEKTRSISIADRVMIEGPGMAVAVSGAIADVVSPTQFECARLANFETGEFDGAKLQFGWEDGAYTGGENAGEIVGVESFTNSGGAQTLLLANTPRNPLSAGDDFRIFRRGAEWSVEGVNLPDPRRRHIEIAVMQRIGG